MHKIALAYSNSVKFANNKVFDSGLTEQEQFHPVDCKEPVPTTVTDQGTMLNGRNFCHHLFNYKIYNFVISADELVNDSFYSITYNTKLNFLQEFWKAKYKYLFVLPAAAGNYYIRVQTEGGDFPISYVEDIEYFPEITLKLTKAMPDA